MICGICKTADTTIEHVKHCSEEHNEDRARRAIGVPTTAEKIEAPRNVSKWQKVTEDGMYRVGDDVFKVQLNLAGTHLYAKRLVVETDIDQDGKMFVLDARFEYAAGALQSIEATDKMSLEDAQAFGKLYGVCCKCGARLTNEASISAGIGPICAQGF